MCEECNVPMMEVVCTECGAWSGAEPIDPLMDTDSSDIMTWW